MSDHIETRKLAAVMFTDIEGYTTMFHDNEASAIDKIEYHRQYLEEITRKHKGTIIQFYGDGSLVIFDSVIDAVRSAIDIQLNSISQHIPVRIGIHLGDLILKDGSIFGDVVNVASRIQAVGVPGSIVVSKKVLDELSNHPEITTSGLGKFELKNIREQQDLYAITGHGLLQPKKQIAQVAYKPKSLLIFLGVATLFSLAVITTNNLLDKGQPSFLKEERIAVPPFENFTSRAELNTLSLMAAHWITTELIESVDANVVSYQSSLFNTNTSEASMPVKPSFAKQTGAVNMIKGAFSYTGKNQDSLVFWANILNVLTGKPLPVELAKAYCKADDPLVCIKEMSNEIKGFWKSKNDKVLSPPNYNAYIAYLQAQNNWDALDDSLAESYLRTAINYDPNFLDAYVLLLDLFYNKRNSKEAFDTLKSLRMRFTDLTSRQENSLLYHEKEIDGKRVEAFRYFLKEYSIDPKDRFVNTSGMVLAIDWLNDPATALRFYEDIEMDSLDLNTCFYCRERAIKALQAYMLSGDLSNAGKMAEKLKPYATQRDDYMRLIEWYMQKGDTATVNALLMKASQAPLDHDYRYLYFVAGRQAALKGDVQIRNFFADKAISLYKGKPSRALARAYYLKEDLVNAEKTYQLALKEPDADKRIVGELGVIYARKGEKQKAMDVIKTLGANKAPFDFGETPYFQGRIFAVLGDKTAAIQYLNKALDEGQIFTNSVTFYGDPDLMGLKNEKGYKDLLIRNIYTWN